ncbi:MAG TPA: alpha/beta hydrolase [Burkholderiaceae bacterium]|jgi:2-(acetamidomethylene)succinate hydrolase|nr:alpha/beta hydrolase [Burkholderiaceae bacterium]
MIERTYPTATTPIFGVGDGRGPLVVCMHGITANAYVFEPVIRALADRYAVISIDQRGHGRSGRPSGYGGTDFAADVAALVEQLDQGPAILLGHSLGARNAFVAANRHPDCVRAVVAVEFTPFIEAEVLDQLESRVMGGDRVFADVPAIEAYLADRYPLLPPQAISRRARHGYRRTERGWQPLTDAAAMAATAAGLREPIEKEVAAIRQPTILVRGAISKFVSRDAWRRTCSLRPDLRAVEVDGADHYVPEERPEAIAAIVREIDAV